MRLISTLALLTLSTVVSSIVIPNSHDIWRKRETAALAFSDVEDRLEQHRLEVSFCDNILDGDNFFSSKSALTGIGKLGMQLLCRLYQPLGPSKRHIEKRMGAIAAIEEALSLYHDVKSAYDHWENFNARGIVEGCHNGEVQLPDEPVVTAMPTAPPASFSSLYAGATFMASLSADMESQWAAEQARVTSITNSAKSSYYSLTCAAISKAHSLQSNAQVIKTSIAGVISSVVSDHAAATTTIAATATTTSAICDVDSFADIGACIGLKKRDTATSDLCQASNMPYVPTTHTMDNCVRIWPRDNFDDGTYANSTKTENDTRTAGDNNSNSLDKLKENYTKALAYYPFYDEYYGHLDESGSTPCISIKEYDYLKIYGMRSVQFNFWHGLKGSTKDYAGNSYTGECDNKHKVAATWLDWGGPTTCQFCDGPKPGSASSDTWSEAMHHSELAYSNIQVTVGEYNTFSMSYNGGSCSDPSQKLSKANQPLKGCQVSKVIIDGTPLASPYPTA